MNMETKNGNSVKWICWDLLGLKKTSYELIVRARVTMSYRMSCRRIWKDFCQPHQRNVQEKKLGWYLRQWIVLVVLSTFLTTNDAWKQRNKHIGIKPEGYTERCTLLGIRGCGNILIYLKGCSCFLIHVHCLFLHYTIILMCLMQYEDKLIGNTK